MTTPRMSITFTEPQMAYLTEEAGKLGISVANLVGRIVDQHRNPPVVIAAARAVYRTNSSRRGERISSIRQHMEEDGRYIPPKESERRQQYLDIYRRVMAGEKMASVGRSVGISRASIDIHCHLISREVEQRKLCQEHPEMIAYSPLPTRLHNVLRNEDISQFHELNGLSRSHLAKAYNCGRKSMDLLEAYLEFKFPQYKLAD